MRFQAKTEEEIAAENLFPAGEYDFEVLTGEDAVSKSSGAEMIKLNVRVYGPDGGFRLVDDYLLEKMAYKLRHFCGATGLMDAYESGNLTGAMCSGRSGRLKLEVQPERTDKNTGKTYAPKNSIKDYIVGDGTTRPAVPPVRSGTSKAALEEEDDIPF
jgi:hypothetical protein